MVARAAPSADSELLTVQSKDGTRIGMECAGAGPTVLFVHGGVGDRTRWTPMFSLLTARFTACAMDRRGRGASSDSPQYSLTKEAEDEPPLHEPVGNSLAVAATLEDLIGKGAAAGVGYVPLRPWPDEVGDDADAACCCSGS